MQYTGLTEQQVLFGTIKDRANLALDMHMNRMASAKVMKSKILLSMIFISIILFYLPQILVWCGFGVNQDLDLSVKVFISIILWSIAVYSFFKLEYVPQKERELIKQIGLYVGLLNVSTLEKIKNDVSEVNYEKIEAVVNILSDDGLLYSKAALQNIIRLCHELQEDLNDKINKPSNKSTHGDVFAVAQDSIEEVEYEDYDLFNDEGFNRNYPGIVRKI